MTPISTIPGDESADDSTCVSRREWLHLRAYFRGKQDGLSSGERRKANAARRVREREEDRQKRKARRLELKKLKGLA